MNIGSGPVNNTKSLKVFGQKHRLGVYSGGAKLKY